MEIFLGSFVYLVQQRQTHTHTHTHTKKVGYTTAQLFTVELLFTPE